MQPHMFRAYPAAIAIAAALAVTAACSGPTAFSPTAPSVTAAPGTAGTAVSGATVVPDDPCEITPEKCDPPPPPPGDEGCTPGYWKNHLASWPPTGFSTGQALTSVFGPNALPGTLLDALSFGGGPGITGAKQILLRAAVAALLNAASPDVDYTRTTAEVIAAVDTALASDDRGVILALATALDTDNNLGCPIN